MQTNSATGTKLKLPLGLGLAVLVVAAAVVIPTVAPPDPMRPRLPRPPTCCGGARDGRYTTWRALSAALEDELAQVRRVTARFHDLEAAVAAGYELGWVNGSGVRIITGCVAHPTAGAMGYHYFNDELMDDLAVDVLEPEVPGLRAGGEREARARRRGVGRPRPELQPARSVRAAEPCSGCTMHILVPAVGFYIMHAWVWKHNPAGMFEDWNPEVTCP